MAAFPEKGRLIGIDFGEKRIGLAICDRSRRLATPYGIYERRSEKLDAEYFRSLVAQEGIVGFVVGLPIHADGQESRQSSQARQFGEWLERITGCPVCFIDERYTSQQADSLMRQLRLTLAQKKKRRDMIAAQIILSTYLESPHLAAQEPEALEDL
jgi:putative Holliday junction resolvase